MQLTTSFFNFGNVKADSFPIVFEWMERNSPEPMELGAGSAKVVMWPWTPQAAGETTLSFIIDPDDDMEEIQEDNNRLDVQVNVYNSRGKTRTAARSRPSPQAAS